MSGKKAPISEGGYLVFEEDLPEILRQAQLLGEHLLGIFAFRLLCESEKMQTKETRDERQKTKGD